jgi:hypothetical protein
VGAFKLSVELQANLPARRSSPHQAECFLLARILNQEDIWGNGENMIRKRTIIILLALTVCGFVSLVSAQTDRRAPASPTVSPAASPALNDSRQTSAVDGGVFLKNIRPAPNTSGLFLSSNGQITQLVSDEQVARWDDDLVSPSAAVNTVNDVVFISPTGLFRLSGGIITSIATNSNELHCSFSPFRRRSRKKPLPPALSRRDGEEVLFFPLLTRDLGRPTTTTVMSLSQPRPAPVVRGYFCSVTQP